MNNQKKNSSGLPLLIIGLVLIVAVVGFLYFYNASRSGTATKTATNTTASPKANNAAAPNSALVSGPAGAVPPNMLGSPTASVTVEEFADYQCPTCATMHPLMKEVTGVYGSRIKFIFRNFPLIQMHNKAYDAAVAAEAASLQGKFWDMQTQLFQNQKTWVAAPDHKALFDEYAKTIGLDVKKFQDDMAGMSAKMRVDADMTRGRAANINGTPSVFVNGMAVPFEQMNINALRQIIDAELAKQTSQNTAPAAPAPVNAASPAKNSNSK